MFTKFSLWMTLMVRWMRSSKECRRLRRQRDVLYNNMGLGLFEMMPKDLSEVCDQIDEERKK